MLTQTEIFKLLQDSQALILNSHIVYTSGKHGSAYVNKDALYPHTKLTSTLCLQMAHDWKEFAIDAVLAPAIGGIVLSQWIAYHLSDLLKKDIFAVYAEKEGDTFVVKRGYDALIRNKKVLLLEDVLTTGGSIKKVVEVTRKIPAEIVGIAAFCNRGNINPSDVGEVPRLTSLFTVTLEAWDAEECLLCKKHFPINTQVGKGKAFLEGKK